MVDLFASELKMGTSKCLDLASHMKYVFDADGRFYKHLIAL